MKKTFFFVYLNAVYGGAETYILRKTRWLIENSFNVKVVCNEGPMIQLYEEAGSSVIKINNNMPINLMNDAELSCLMRGIFRKSKNDLVEVVECYDIQSLAISERIARFFGSKISIGILSAGIFPNSMKNKLRFYAKHGSLFSINEPTSVYVKKSLGIMKVPVVRVPLDLSEKKAQSQQSIWLDYNANEFKILTLARLSPDKAYLSGLISEFLRVYGSLRAPSRLYIAGDGPFRIKLEKLASVSDPTCQNRCRMID